MVSTIHQQTLYEYQIELVNRRGGRKMVRDYQSTFKPGESWGYNKYARHDVLEREEFLDPSSGQLEILYRIRIPFYYQILNQKQVYIGHLDAQIAQQEVEIRELQARLEA